MASVFKRKQPGCESAFYAKVDLGERTTDGKIVWRMRRVPDEHQSSRPVARRWADAHEAEEQEKRKRGVVAEQAPKLCGALMDEWEKTLTNRNAEIDRGRLAKHVRPAFKDLAVGAVAVPNVMRWIDAQRAVKKIVDGKEVQALSDASLRQNLNLLSRFFSWAITRGHCGANPVRNIPTGQRPQQTPKRDQPYIDSDEAALRMIGALPEPFNLMFYIGHTSGLRLGEVVGLRMGDVDKRFLDAGAIRVCHSYDGPLKETKRGETSKPKYPPIGAEFEDVMRPWITRRLAEGATAESYLFEHRPKAAEGEAAAATHYHRQTVHRAWVKAKRKVGVKVTFYQGTRHSFASRLLDSGDMFEQVSPALGHASQTTTQRFYDHHTVKYAPTMRMRLGVKPSTSAPVLPIQRGRTDGR